MNATQFLAEIVPIIRTELDDDGLAIDLRTNQTNLPGWDSLAHVRIVVAVEQAFGVQFDVSEIESINSVQGFYDAVTRHKG